MQRILVGLLLLAWPGLLIAQDKLRADLDTSHIPAAFNGYAKVMRYKTERVELTGPGRYTMQEDYAITVMKPSPEPLQDYVPYNKFTRVLSMAAYVYDAKGKLLRRLSEGDAVDLKAIQGLQFYDDSRVKALAASHNEYPYTVVFRNEHQHQSTFQYPGWVAISTGDYPTLASTFEVLYPSELPIKYQCVNAAPEPKKEAVGSQTLLRWQAAELRPRTPKLVAPRGINSVPHVRLMQPTFDYAGYKGSSGSWQEFGAFLYDMFKQRQTLPDADVIKLRELTAGARTQKEKAAIAYRYLQNSTRYVAILFGVGGFQPMTPAEVRANDYGECKALSNLLVGMLDTLGIEAYHVIVFADPDYRGAPVLQGGFPESKANHCIAMAILDGDSTWFECTSDILTPGDLSDFTENRQAILLTPRGGVLVNTPASTARKNWRSTVATGALNPEGVLELTMASRLRGDFNSDARQLLNGAPSSRHEEWFRESLPLPTFELRSVDYGSFTQPDTALTLTASVRVPQYGTRAGTRLLVRPAAFASQLPQLPADSARTEPVWLRRPLTEDERVTLKLPEGYRLSRTPEPVSIEGPCGSYQSRVDYNPETHTVTYSRRFVIDRFRLPAASYSGVQQFFHQVNKANDAKLVLMKGT